jgi:hypothetical protein
MNVKKAEKTGFVECKKEPQPKGIKGNDRMVNILTEKGNHIVLHALLAGGKVATIINYAKML